MACPVTHVRAGKVSILLLAESNKAELEIPGELMHTGKVTAAIDSRIRLAEVAAAIRHAEEGRAHGTIVIEIDQAAAGPCGESWAIRAVGASVATITLCNILLC